MILLKTYSFFTNIKRCIQIFWIILMYYFVGFMSNFKITRRLVPKLYKFNGVAVSQSARLRISIERLGPTFVKFAQLLAERSDITPDHLVDELKKLHSNVEPFDHRIALQLIENELRAPIAEHFNRIDSVCLASASIGQVYGAELKTGEQVVIKIQRPGIEKKIKQDLILLKWFFRKLKNDMPELNAVEMDEILEDFGKGLLKELDYRYEASNILRFKDSLRDLKFCKIPELYNYYTTKKMLVMERIDGVHIMYKNTLIAKGYSPQIIANNLSKTFLNMIFVNGMFHADPHRGNILILENNRIALIDFGLIGVIKPRQINYVIHMIVGLEYRNARMISDSLTKLCGVSDYNDNEEIEFGIQNILKRSDQGGAISLSLVITDCIELLIENNLKIPSNIVLMLKSLVTIENNLKALDPDYDMIKSIKPYAKSILKQRITIDKVAQEGYYTIKKYIEFAKQLPNNLGQIMENIKRGRLIHDVKFSNDGKMNRTIKNIGSLLASALLTGFVLLVSTALILSNQVVMFSKFLFVMASINAIWVLFKINAKVKDYQ